MSKLRFLSFFCDVKEKKFCQNFNFWLFSTKLVKILVFHVNLFQFTGKTLSEFGFLVIQGQNFTVLR